MQSSEKWFVREKAAVKLNEQWMETKWTMKKKILEVIPMKGEQTSKEDCREVKQILRRVKF